MTARHIIRIDATQSPVVAAGDRVCKGQNLCAADAQALCPVSGVVEEVQFDPAQHEFVISISPVEIR
jgi:Na+-translocating ferredoxin:NAD+ oxidoreductase RnfC subunit